MTTISAKSFTNIEDYFNIGLNSNISKEWRQSSSMNSRKDYETTSAETSKH